MDSFRTRATIAAVFVALSCASALGPATAQKQQPTPQIVCEDGTVLIFGEVCPCRHPSHGIERYQTEETLTGAPGTPEWSSASDHGKNDKVKHCESRRKSILSAFPDAVLSNPFGEFKESDGQYSYRCRWNVKRDPIFVLKASEACLRNQ